MTELIDNTLYFGKFTAKQVDAMTQWEKDYLILQSYSVLDVILNRYGVNLGQLSVCPRCHVDDFTHVEGCEFIPAEYDEE